jgi:hypothetical protein
MYNLSMNETKKSKKLTPKVVDVLPRRSVFAQPNFERQHTHKEDVEMEMSCSVCNRVFEENSEHYYVWLGQPDMNNYTFQVPTYYSCDSSRCMEENNTNATRELYWYNR